MPNALEVTFTSVWDGGEEITTSAKVDQDTGVVSDIEASEDGVEDLETLDREYVTLENGQEVDVERSEGGEYLVKDMQAFRAAVEASSPAP